MPDFTYTGGTERVYPETRDSYGVNLGLVKPGDVFRLDAAPDQFWAPYEDGETGSEDEGPPADPETPPEPAPDVNPGE